MVARKTPVVARKPRQVTPTWLSSHCRLTALQQKAAHLAPPAQELLETTLRNWKLV